MSTSVLPALPGLGFPWTRDPTFQTRKPRAISGKQTRIADWSYPIYTWSLTYNILRQGSWNGSSFWTEYSTMRGFFESLLGGWDSFLYTDVDDNIVTGQSFGVGDGSTTEFQLQRTSGGYTIPIYAPNLGLTFNVYVNGVLKTLGTDYTVSAWGATVPGVVTFATAPTSTYPLTVDMSYYFPCTFDEDKLTFSKFLSNVYNLKKLSFSSIK